MINAERLLGTLVRSALSSGKRRRRHINPRRMMRGNNVAVGMGVLGLAIGAFEHYSKQSAGGVEGTPARVSGTLPPTPPEATMSPPPPPPPPPSPETNEQSLLLLRAMILAANADGAIDASERANILNSARTSGISTEDEKFLEKELNNPVTVNEIVKAVSGADMAKQVYAASLIAITLDSDQEEAYLSELASRLNLGANDISEITGQLGINDEEN